MFLNDKTASRRLPFSHLTLALHLLATVHDLFGLRQKAKTRTQNKRKTKTKTKEKGYDATCRMRNNLADTDTFCFTSCLGSRPKCAEHSIELFIALEILLIIFVESTELRIQFKHTHIHIHIFIFYTSADIFRNESKPKFNWFICGCKHAPKINMFLHVSRMWLTLKIVIIINIWTIGSLGQVKWARHIRMYIL